MTERIIIDIVAVFLLSGIAYGVGYKAGKRFAVLVATRVLSRLDLDLDPHPDRPLAVFPSPLAEFIGALYGRPASSHRIQEDLDEEARIHLGETWRTSRSRRR